MAGSHINSSSCGGKKVHFTRLLGTQKDAITVWLIIISNNNNNELIVR